MTKCIVSPPAYAMPHIILPGRVQIMQLQFGIQFAFTYICNKGRCRKVGE